MQPAPVPAGTRGIDRYLSKPMAYGTGRRISTSAQRFHVNEGQSQPGLLACGTGDATHAICHVGRKAEPLWRGSRALAWHAAKLTLTRAGFRPGFVHASA